ncbi:MAG TPA: ABC transporter ATP-binding protein [Saprospiraceae bacterium]|nr:ABC transporter ATP-binding protein [Saprospiraceae bacterium]
MKEIAQIVGYLRGYKWPLFLSISSNILMALFVVVSIPTIIPFFQILFDRIPETPAERPDFSFGDLEDYAKYHFSTLIETRGRTGALTLVCIALVAVFFLKNFFRYMAMFFMAIVRNGIVTDMRQKLFGKYIDLPLAFFSGEKKGDLISRITTDVQEIEFSVLGMLQAVFREPIVIIGSIAFMIYISPSLTLFVAVLIAFTILVVGGISRTLKRKSLAAQRSIGNLVAISEESLQGIRIIKGFNAQELQEQKFAKESNAYRRLLTRILWRRDLSSPLSEFLGITVLSVLLWYGSQQVFKNDLTPEIFFAFLFAFFNVIDPAKNFSTAYYHIQKGMGAMHRINEILDLRDRIQQKPDAIAFSEFKQSIEFRNVSFRHKGSDTWALYNVNFKILKGQVVALVGSSGSGKSTLVDLIPRFHDVTDGEILIDGVNIKDYHLQSLRTQMGIVSQEAILFNDTIRNNIVFSSTGKTERDILDAARNAHAHGFITDAPQGYDTIIGDRGMKLSGGERQRLTIARALLKNPPILILDEATAALDSESERLVQEALERVMEGRTSVVIAHRLSTIQHADVIYVLKEGEIVESGTHGELLLRDGEYQKFIRLQAV